MGSASSGPPSSFAEVELLQEPDSDLEDNAQLAFALDQCCDVVLTHDRGLLSRSVPAPLLLLTPEAFLEKCRGVGASAAAH